ncbi:MAG: porin family protein [Henriciella sp.]|nr:porin family protein [Henriciella sp.]
MQPNKLILSTALTLSCFLPFAQADDWYAETFVAGIYVDGEDYVVGPDENSLSSVGLRGGYKLSKNFSLEVEAQTGLDGDTNYSLGLGEINLDASYGLFGTYSAPVSDKLSLHGRVGVVRNEYLIESNLGGSKVTTSDSFAFGVGTTFDLTDTLYLRGDLTQFNSYSADSSSLSVGAGFRF